MFQESSCSISSKAWRSSPVWSSRWGRATRPASLKGFPEARRKGRLPFRLYRHFIAGAEKDPAICYRPIPDSLRIFRRLRKRTQRRFDRVLSAASSCRREDRNIKIDRIGSNAVHGSSVAPYFPQIMRTSAPSGSLTRGTSADFTSWYRGGVIFSEEGRLAPSWNPYIRPAASLWASPGE